MITGAHSILYSTNGDADRAFLRDVLKLPHVDVGQGWLIFGLPPAEVAVHPGERNDHHEFFLMCDDVEALVAGLRGQGHECSEISDQGWGRITNVTLPGGGKLGIYEPRHARPPMAGGAAKGKAKAKAKAKGKAKTKAKPKKKTVKKAKPAAKKKAKPAKKAKGKAKKK